MDQTAPQQAMDGFEQGVMVVDERGFVRLVNRAAGEQLGIDPVECLGKRCWNAARLQSLDGRPFCSPDCKIQQQARAGTLSPCARARRRSKNGPGRELGICTVLVSPQHDRRFALIHIFSPAAAENERPGAARPDPSPDRCLRPNSRCGDEVATGASWRQDCAEAQAATGADPDRLEQLSEREEEVLELMAGGLDTGAIARTLGICPTTVRNHIQRILVKLHVHGRLPAVLVWLVRHASPAGPQG